MTYVIAALCIGVLLRLVFYFASAFPQLDRLTGVKSTARNGDELKHDPCDDQYSA